MDLHDIKRDGFEPGTFGLGQKLWHTDGILHRFQIPNPACHGSSHWLAVCEMIVDKKTYTVKNIITTRDTEICKEVYMTADDDKLICKDIDGENHYYLSKEEAQAACDEYNKVNQVYELVSKYKQYQIC